MAFTTRTITVTDTATAIVPVDGEAPGRADGDFAYSLHFTVPATPTVVAGGPSVTFAGGKTLTAAAEFSAMRSTGDVLYLICDTAQTVDIDVLFQGV